MRKTDQYKLIFNGAGVFIALTVGVYFIRTLTNADAAGSCSGAYNTAIPMTLQRPTGELMSTIELEARLGGRDISVAAFGEAVPGTGSGKPAVLQVRLPKGSVSPATKAGTAGGVGFDWQPNGIADASSVCMSYAVWLPKDFDFSRGGTLPGLFGSGTDAKGHLTTAFGTRLMWRDKGEAEVQATVLGTTERRANVVKRDIFKLPRGQWLPVDQEIVLNTPGKRDGAVRLWAGGTMQYEKKGLELRTHLGEVVSGVRFDVHYGGVEPSYAAPKDTVIRVTPPTLRIN